MSNRIAIAPSGPITASIRPPGSKSITNRALVCAALAEGTSRLSGALRSEDTEVMIAALRQLGLNVSTAESGTLITVDGGGGVVPVQQADIYVANSGTTIRFLTAMVAALQGEFRLDGIPRMRERPIADLLDALNQLGGDARSEAGTGCPPVRVHARGLTGGRAVIRGSISSQFLSGLLMAAPYSRQDVQLDVDGVLVSQPYVHMTLGVMRAFGVEADPGNLQQFRIPAAQHYRGTSYDIEPDASAASYFWGAAAVTGGRITVEGLGPDALQGDVQFCQCLEQMGCKVQYEPHQITVTGQTLRGIDVNMNAISDTVQTLAAVALFAEGPTRITGVGHIRHKETDRVGDLARELRKLGAEVTEQEDGLTITPGTPRAAEIATYNDHRMAMSLALVGLRVPGIVICDPECTAKTYPEFFEDLDALRS